MAHVQGHVKRNPSTGDVALRTRYEPTNDKLAAMLWLVSSPVTGVKYVGDDFVDGWDDLFTPEGS